MESLVGVCERREVAAASDGRGDEAEGVVGRSGYALCDALIVGDAAGQGL